MGNNTTFCGTNRIVEDWQACVLFQGVDPSLAWCASPVTKASSSSGLSLKGSSSYLVGLLLLAGAAFARPTLDVSAAVEGVEGVVAGVVEGVAEVIKPALKSHIIGPSHRFGYAEAKIGNLTFEQFLPATFYEQACLDSPTCAVAYDDAGAPASLAYVAPANASAAAVAKRSIAGRLSVNADAATVNAGNCDIIAMIHSTGYDNCHENACSITARDYTCYEEGFGNVKMTCSIGLKGSYPGWIYRDTYTEGLKSFAANKLKKWTDRYQYNGRENSWATIYWQQAAWSVYATVWHGDYYKGEMQYTFS